METINLQYKFNGEPDYNFIFKDKDDTILKRIIVWEGYIDALLSKLPPNSKGEWEGVLLCYHLHTGWYENNYWEIKDIPLLLSQLSSLIDNSLLKIEKEILDFLLSELSRCISGNRKVFIEY